MKELLHHMIFPRHSNNHRAKLLHLDSLFLLNIVLLVVALLISNIRSTEQNILGLATNITVDELLTLTNQKRVEHGLSPLGVNEQLSRAAQEKAKDMMDKNYWAHNAPDGTTPWVFIKQAGYTYSFAGENLARNFTESDDIVTAWMDSPGHRDNILSPYYQDIGFAVVEGTLTGTDTVLVVQMFGKPSGAVFAQEKKTPSPVNIQQPIIAREAQQSLHRQLGVGSSHASSLPGISVEKIPFVDTFAFSWNINVLILTIVISVLFIDMIIVQRRRIMRLGGHGLDHIFFLSIILLLVLLYKSGTIL